MNLLRSAPFLIAVSVLANVGVMRVGAISVSVTGPNGSNGDPGVAGDPGTAGGKGGAGGLANATANSAADASNDATATGGNGGNGGVGGNGTPTAPDNDADSGAGGNGGMGGPASASASTILSSPNTTSASATANGGAGGHGARGGTPAGNGLEAPAGNGDRGGNATASTTVNNLIGDATGDAKASGGEGGGSTFQFGPNFTGAAGGDAFAEVDVAAQGAIVAAAQATGGVGGNADNGNAGAGGATAFGTVRGTSTADGRVQVVASTRAGDGGRVMNGAGSGGRGADAVLNNVVNGQTGAAGTLSLYQTAQAGRGGSARGGLAGAAGNAQSVLTLGRSVASLGISVIAIAGGGGSNILSGAGAAGGNANAELNASSTGSVFLTAQALAGFGGGTGADAPPGAAGDATATAIGTNSFDGSLVDVTADATGGQGGQTGAGQNSVARIGGTGASRASGTANGGGNFVLAHSIATGGPGGAIALAEGQSVFVSGGTGGKGGTAISSAIGTIPDAATVNVKAEAYGGRGGGLYAGGVSGGGGDAIATATGETSGGTATVNAIARSGSVGSLGSTGPNTPAEYGAAGTAVAATRALGASGTATSFATSFGGGDFHRLIASASAPVDGTVSTESRASIGASAIDRTLATGISVAAFANASLAGSIAPLEEVFFSAAYPENGSGTSHLFSATISLRPGDYVPAEIIGLRFTGATSSGAGFDLLRFRFRNSGATLFDVTFTDVATALAFFNNDQVFELGARGTDRFVSLDLVFDMTSDDPGASFGVGALLGKPDVVPEPHTWAVALLGFALLAIRKQARASFASK